MSGRDTTRGWSILCRQNEAVRNDLVGLKRRSSFSAFQDGTPPTGSLEYTPKFRRLLPFPPRGADHPCESPQLPMPFG
jgi:hypothetical protein